MMKSNIEQWLEMKREQEYKEIEEKELKEHNGELPSYLKSFIDDMIMFHNLQQRDGIFLIGFIEYMFKYDIYYYEPKDIKELAKFLGIKLEQCRIRLYKLVKAKFIVKEVDKESTKYKLNRFLFGKERIQGLSELTLEIYYTDGKKNIRVLTD